MELPLVVTRGHLKDIEHRNHSHKFWILILSHILWHSAPSIHAWTVFVTQQFDLRSVWLMEVNVTLISKDTAMAWWIKLLNQTTAVPCKIYSLCKSTCKPCLIDDHYKFKGINATVMSNYNRTLISWTAKGLAKYVWYNQVLLYQV